MLATRFTQLVPNQRPLRDSSRIDRNDTTTYRYTTIRSRPMDSNQSTTHLDRVLPGEQTEAEHKEPQDDSDRLCAPVMQVLDPRGDLKLCSGDTWFLVSSNILMLSSRYFEKMLQTDAFAEGLAQPTGNEPPTKVLGDIDLISFGIMCKLLHFHEVLPLEHIEELGALADTCDYYGSERAISVHIRAWIQAFEQPRGQLTVDELQKLLWVAYAFRLEHSFAVFSVQLAAALDVESLDALDLRSMPETVLGESWLITPFMPYTVL